MILVFLVERGGQAYNCNTSNLFNDLSSLLRDSIVVANMNKSMPFLLRLVVNKT